VFVSCS